jgi:hypothetical protein
MNIPLPILATYQKFTITKSSHHGHYEDLELTMFVSLPLSIHTPSACESSNLLSRLQQPSQSLKSQPVVPAMELLDLPLEIFERVIAHYVDGRGIRRAWLRRDVCS